MRSRAIDGRSGPKYTKENDRIRSLEASATVRASSLSCGGAGKTRILRPFGHHLGNPPDKMRELQQSPEIRSNDP